ncbi:MAG: glycosyltransferase family 39 protein [Acidobacteriia bacterium]|nr:glycosyltransferase family 39 protein [Terriglobia bacterium]
MNRPTALPWFRYAAAAVVFLLCFAWFSFHVEQIGLASQWVDPVSEIPAQDEAIYAHEAIVMVTAGQWLTPVYLGRYALNKPPLLQWLCAISIKVLGITRGFLRLPSLIAASLTAAVVFLAIWRMQSLFLALAGVLLLASSHLFYVFSRLSMTDMLLTFWITAALLIAWCDPALKKQSSATAFGFATGAAILSKAAAGLAPLLALGIVVLVSSRESRPHWTRLFTVVVTAALVAVPWHLYQMVQHPHWFFAEYIATQHLSVGVFAPPQYSNENHLLFYIRRLFLMDPVLTITGALAVLVVLGNWRKQPLLIAWLLSIWAMLFGFRYRSAYYLLPLIPVLAVMSVQLLGRISRMPHAAVLVILMLCTMAKGVFAGETWGIPLGTSDLPIARSLDSYCEERRDNGLILVGDADKSYAADLPLAGLRYCWLEKRQDTAGKRPPLDFAWLGVTVSVAEFQRLPSLLPRFRERLAGFDLPSDAAVATVISAQSPEEVSQLISSHPDTDFWVPDGLLRGVDTVIPHQVKPTKDGGVFLIARHTGSFDTPRSCRL